MDSQEHVKLSIIIPTIGRTEELEELLQSIVDANILFLYEIIIIDQNTEGFLNIVLTNFMRILPIKHHQVDFHGLSKAKNYGVSVSNGIYISFPDDDCKIFPETYDNAFHNLEKYSLDMVFGKCVDENGNDSVLNFQKKSYLLHVKNMLGGFVEATVVAERNVLEKYRFDENMGAGCFFGAEEGYDWLYRILSENPNYQIMYTPEIMFYHPQVIQHKGDYASLNRVFKYRCGTAYLCVKHGFANRLKRRIWLSYFASLYFKIFNKSKASYYKVEKNALELGAEFAKLKLDK